MSVRRFLAFAGPLVLIGTASLPAAADAGGQITYTPDISVPVKANGIQVLPPVLGLSSLVYTSPVKFEERNGRLVVTQPPQGFLLTHTTGKILWSGLLSTKPRQFTFVTTSSAEELKDNAGEVVWSRETQPSLTLDFDRPGQVRLLNAAGKELGTAPADNSTLPVFPVHHHREPFFGWTSDHGSIRVEKDTEHGQTTIYSGTHLVWSGPNPSNDGIRYGRSPGSPVSGIASSWLPAGTALALKVTRDVGSVEISDEMHHRIETVSTETLHLTATSDDPAFRKTAQYYMLSEPITATTQVDLSVPGLIYIRYHTASGIWSGEEVVHALSAVWHNIMPHRSWSEPGLDLWTAYFDETGKRISTMRQGFRPFKQS